MDLVYEVGLWVASVVISFILGWFTNWFFYRKQRKEGEANTEILKQLQSYNNAEIRLGNDKRGKIVKREDGTYGIAWIQQLKEQVTVTATPRVEVEKKKDTQTQG